VFLCAVRADARIRTVLFLYPKRGVQALCRNRYVLPSWPWWLTAVCAFAEPLDWIVDWIVDKPWIQQFVGASMVGQHWMSFVEENATIDLSRAHAYDGPPLAYVVNNALLRTRLRTAGVTVMADCLDLNVSCAPDILDPIVAQSLHRHFDTSSIRDEH
jgi:hypothetical protein